ncbi:MAG: peptidase [Nevskiales bacterium]
MTYCLAIKVNQGLVFASDSRTSASMDDIRTYSKMHTFTPPSGAVFVLLSAGNLATTQAVRAAVQRDLDDGAPQNLNGFKHMYDAAEYVARLNVRAQKLVVEERRADIVGLDATFIVGGQIPGEEPTLYLIYGLGNYIAVSPDMPFLQIGESKYGKPILDRTARLELALEDAARCALVSLDSTMRSNISVAPPIDLLLYRNAEFAIKTKLRFDYDTPYYRSLRSTWGRELEAIFEKLPRFEWEPQTAAVAGPRPVSEPDARPTPRQLAASSKIQGQQ